VDHALAVANARDPAMRLHGRFRSWLSGSGPTSRSPPDWPEGNWTNAPENITWIFSVGTDDHSRTGRRLYLEENSRSGGAGITQWRTRGRVTGSQGHSNAEPSSAPLYTRAQTRATKKAPPKPRCCRPPRATKRRPAKTPLARHGVRAELLLTRQADPLRTMSCFPKRRCHGLTWAGGVLEREVSRGADRIEKHAPGPLAARAMGRRKWVNARCVEFFGAKKKPRGRTISHRWGIYRRAEGKREMGPRKPQQAAGRRSGLARNRVLARGQGIGIERWSVKQQAWPRLFVVTSGKGGVGKTTTTAAARGARALAGKAGKMAWASVDVAIVGLRQSSDLVMGAERFASIRLSMYPKAR